METVVVGVLVGVWLLVTLPGVVAPWATEAERSLRPEPSVRPLPTPAGRPGEDADRPAA